jgi:alkylated DNA repair dioxygenase AlkB
VTVQSSMSKNPAKKAPKTFLPITAAPVDFYPNFYTASEADALYASLLAMPGWVQGPNVPRREHYVNAYGPIPYTYGSFPYARTYQPVPASTDVSNLMARVSEFLGCKLDVCFSNMYSGPSNGLGWHADDSPEMDPDRPIVSVSFGQARAIRFRPNSDPAHVEELILTHGSVAVMRPGMQLTWQHSIPKSPAQHAPGLARISCTLRGFRAV